MDFMVEIFFWEFYVNICCPLRQISW
jgi:hypothetical protein